MTIPHQWERLENWLAQNLPDTLTDLNPGATGEALKAVEEALGVTLPDSFKELYLRHNGQKGAATGLFYGMKFLPLDQVQMEWGVWRDLFKDDPKLGSEAKYTSQPAEAIQEQYINLKWVPFTSDYGGNHLGLDLDPGAAGKAGQVINFGRDEKNKFVLGQNIEVFMEWYVQCLEQGEFSIVEEDGRKRLGLKEPAQGHLFDALSKLFTT